MLGGIIFQRHHAVARAEDRERDRADGGSADAQISVGEQRLER
jgi:hypothetical protein